MKKNLLIFILALFLTGCSHSEPKEMGFLDSARNIFNKKMFVASTRYMIYKEPTGALNTFPNGGVSKVLYQVARVYVVDASRGLIYKAFELEAPVNMKTSFKSHILGFKDGSVVIQLSGCDGDECYGDLNNYAYYEIPLNQRASVSYTELRSKPKDFQNPPTMLALAPDETKYYRISTGHNDIAQRFNEDDEFEQAYIVDKMGTLLRYL